MFFVTKRTNCKLNATILMVKKIYKKRQEERLPHVDEIKYHICTQMKYEAYYAKFDQKNDEFRRIWGDTIFSN